MTNVIDLDSRLRHLADDLNHALIEHMVALGDLTAPAWRTAFAAVPRHLFAPRFRLPQNMAGRPTTLQIAPSRRTGFVRCTTTRLC